MEYATDLVTAVANATAIRAMLEDPRWNEAVVPVIRSLQATARTKGENFRRNPSLDNLFQATKYEGHVEFADTLLATFSRIHKHATNVIEEARSVMIAAPTRGTPVMQEPTDNPPEAQPVSDTGKEN